AVAFDAQRMLRDTLARRKSRRALVTGSRIDLVERDHETSFSALARQHAGKAAIFQDELVIKRAANVERDENGDQQCIRPMKLMANRVDRVILHDLERDDAEGDRVPL